MIRTSRATRYARQEKARVDKELLQEGEVVHNQTYTTGSYGNAVKTDWQAIETEIERSLQSEHRSLRDFAEWYFELIDSAEYERAEAVRSCWLAQYTEVNGGSTDASIS
ncbi:hypothetical protein GT360_00305 [Vibrio astriarenae]|uniref:Uncharacterized protein n=1 Tax=Vibrio astriarenae TaxID=1481923 RepID=A0A7Z2YCI6_9VIBR|nr:hypothetical protein [Vibrio astriarenae]QIA62090.1 hypothetical protein GT360_00305 [Vibrio astriarenae]